MEKYIAQILFVIGLAVWLGWVLLRRLMAVDLEKRKAEMGDPPSETQLRHYIKSMREDLSLLTVTNFAVLLVLIFALVLKL
jgi:Mg2+/citrate symporter